MRKHEEFEQLCALAMAGDTSPEELARLRKHLQECESCRREYREFSQFVVPQLWLIDENMPSDDEKVDSMDTTRLRESFFERAQKEGINFSAATVKMPNRPAPASRSAARSFWLPLWSVAATVACLVLLVVLGRRSKERELLPQAPVAAQVPLKVSTVPSTVPRSVSNPEIAVVTHLQSKEQELENTLTILKAKLSAADADRTALNNQLEEKTIELAQLQETASSSQQTIASLRDEVSALQAQSNSREAEYVVAQAEINDLTDQIARQRQAVNREQEMLVAGKDMRDMMAARNLHIVDVVDTDPHGKTKRAFGRVFFAEDRQLVFYAYDLNEKRLQDARYDYRIWGEQQGKPQSARSLGIFYSDNKTEHRWVFKCDDPKVLSEIDTVFVTLESSNAALQHPKGAQLMYAYLRGQANHP
ncbi:MAG TPA: zf-HC2 domain-containing protein [Terracidiphilus sp.]|nr:zf-HC2 domain-containing protein [Terracidiphilus sp.]